MRIYALLVLAATLIAYWPVCGNGFVSFDDPIRVTANPWVQRGLTVESVTWAFTTLTDGHWHPLTWLSHMLDVTVADLHAGWHHGTNVALHAASALLLLAALARMTGAPGRSAMVALLFAVHPLHVESVAWVSERKDTLSGLFWNLALYAYARHAERPSRARFAAVALAFACGLVSKEMVVSLPIVLLLLDLWPLARVRRESLLPLVLEKLPLFALTALFIALAWFAQHSSGAVVTTIALPLPFRAANALVALVAYLGKALWPQGLAFFYPYPSELSLWKVGASALLLLSASAGALRAAATRSYLTVGWFWYLVTVAPVIGLVQIGMQAMADRYTYLPLCGIFIAAVWGAHDLFAARPSIRLAQAPLVAALGMACIVLTRIQVGYWRDDFTLYERAIAVTRDNFLAHNNLAAALMRQDRLAEARGHLEEALRIQPHFPDARNNLAGVLLRQGHTDEAIAELRTVVEDTPGYAPAHRNLAAILAQMGRSEEAAAHEQEARRLESGGGP
ncbi:MAG TPA: tetratricopeptide repeat protein [Myxococcota bacterium]|nr:tetratricopeptide repeat protein [Myxococcota bacterium]